jgi:hypothetical protein
VKRSLRIKKGAVGMNFTNLLPVASKGRENLTRREVHMLYTNRLMSMYTRKRLKEVLMEKRGDVWRVQVGGKVGRRAVTSLLFRVCTQGRVMAILLGRRKVRWWRKGALQPVGNISHWQVAVGLEEVRRSESVRSRV